MRTFQLPWGRMRLPQGDRRKGMPQVCQQVSRLRCPFQAQCLMLRKGLEGGLRCKRAAMQLP